MEQIAIAWNMYSEKIVGTTKSNNLQEMICKFLLFSLSSLSILIRLLYYKMLTEEEVNYLEEPYSPVPVLRELRGSVHFIGDLYYIDNMVFTFNVLVVFSRQKHK
jgi:hypothetical protein